VTSLPIDFPPSADRASRELLRSLQGQTPVEEMPIRDARKQMCQGQDTIFQKSSLFHETLSDGRCRVEILKPKDAGNSLPIIFFLHGGGWVMGGSQTHGYLATELVKRSQCALAFVDYPLAPEVRYPKNLDDAFSAVSAVLAASARYGLDAKRIAFAGDSAGGNLAAALVLRFRSSFLVVPRAQVLLYPALDIRAESASYHDFSTGLNLTQPTMHWFWDQYAPGMRESTDPLLSPLHAPREMLAGLPRTLIVTSEIDVLRDEGELFATLLRQAQVDTSLVRFGGVLHGFMVTEALAKSSSGDLAIQLVADFLRTSLASD